MIAPTDEQADALKLFRSGESMVIEAGAGTGKTSTLKLIAADADARDLRGRYLAFNKAIVADVAGRLPTSCVASTAHSLAMRTVGRPYQHRLGAPRMPSWQLAQILGVDRFVITFDAKQRRTLHDSFLAGLVMRSVANFCKTADEEPSRRHVPYLEGIDLPTDYGARTYGNNNAIAEYLEPFIVKAWSDLRATDGHLPFKHDHYLKLWQLSHPRTEVDYILFDEAQDANPVMSAVIAEQEHAQRVYVGDSNQAIYEFTGAVNALAGIDAGHRRFLTQSFRFGPAIAEAANEVLSELGSLLMLRGLPSIESEVGPFGSPDEADAVLCRTNAGAMTRVFDAVDRGVRAALVGGGAEIASFARAAQSLMDGGRTGHPELACFESWGEVQDYADHDAQGDELKLMVQLVDKFTPATILSAIEGAKSEAKADLIVSTAHKAKGREWGAVMLDEDFAMFASAQDRVAGIPRDPTESELRLRYVATTRARLRLDNSALTAKVPTTKEGDEDAE